LDSNRRADVGGAGEAVESAAPSPIGETGVQPAA
jgi:hypothetical protein